MTRVSRGFGDQFAGVGAFVEAQERKVEALESALRRLHGNIAASFSVSTTADWKEVPASIKRDSCSVRTESTGASTRSHFTVTALVSRDVVQGSALQASESLEGTQRLSSKAPEMKKNQIPLKASRKDSKAISSKDVSQLYQSFENKNNKENKSFKVKSIQNDPSGIRLKSKHCGSNKNSNQKCFDSTSTSSSSSSTEEECCPDVRVCAKACVKIPLCPFPRLRPTAISLAFQTTPINLTLRNCGSILEHRLDRDFIRKIEDKLCELGVQKGILRILPDFLTDVRTGYAGGYSHSTLVARVSFQNCKVQIGLNSLPTILNSGRQLYGRNLRPIAGARPSYVLFPLLPGEFLTSVIDFSLQINLADLERFLDYFKNPDRRSRSSTTSSGRHHGRDKRSSLSSSKKVAALSWEDEEMGWVSNEDQDDDVADLSENDNWF